MSQNPTYFEPLHQRDAFRGIIVRDLNDNKKWVLLEVRWTQGRFVFWLSRETSGTPEVISSAVNLENLIELSTASSAQIIRDKLKEYLGEHFDKTFSEMMAYISDNRATLIHENPDEDEDTGETNPMLRLVGIARQLEYSTEERGDVYATIHVRTDDGEGRYHREMYNIESGLFKRWLRRQYYVHFHQGVGTESLKNATATIRSNVEFGTPMPRIRLWNRIAKDKDGDTKLWWDKNHTYLFRNEASLCEVLSIPIMPYSQSKGEFKYPE